jgi:hypothetical protein
VNTNASEKRETAQNSIENINASLDTLILLISIIFIVPFGKVSPHQGELLV